MFFKPRESPTGRIRYLILFVHILSGVLTAGVIIGYGQLYPMLVDSKVFFDRCGKDFQNATCPQQEALLSSMFSYGATVSIFIQAPSGVFIDVFGPRITALMGMTLFIPGCILFAFSTAQFDLYLVGFLLIAGGGPMVFISIMSTANLFPKYAGMVLMLMNGSYGGGALVFLVFNYLYYKAHISLKWLFNIYAAIAGLIAIIILLTWPLRKYEEVKSDADEHRQIERPNNNGVSKARQIFRDTCNIHYLFLNLFTGVLVLKSNFYLATSDAQLGLIDQSKTDLYSKIFDLAVPIIGFLVGPIGLVVDKLGINAGIYFLLALSSIASICTIIKIMGLQILNFIIFSAYFPYVYSLWCTFIVVRWGFDNYGVLYAGVALTAGFVNLIGNPLATYALNHENFTQINIALLAASLSFIVYPIGMQIYGCSKRNKGTSEETTPFKSNIQ